VTPMPLESTFPASSRNHKMLELPERGFPPSVNKHNGNLHWFCDWIEGSLLFTGTERASRTDLWDRFSEKGLYVEQALFDQWLDNAWSEFERRADLLGAVCPYRIESRAISRAHKWDRRPDYSFCLVASLLHAAPSWRPKDRVAKSHLARKQGALFERLSAWALHALGWTTLLTAWSDREQQKLPSVVTSVAAHLSEPEHTGWHRNVDPKANEAGLDLVLSTPFKDRRWGAPVFLTQCASGDDWDVKLHTPVLDVWTKLVDFASPPRKAFALPVSLDETQLRQTTVKVAGPVFDRYRLVSSSSLEEQLEKDLVKFVRPLLRTLPKEA
jgi:hypothetical protein